MLERIKLAFNNIPIAWDTHRRKDTTVKERWLTSHMIELSVPKTSKPVQIFYCNSTYSGIRVLYPGERVILGPTKETTFSIRRASKK